MRNNGFKPPPLEIARRFFFWATFGQILHCAYTDTKQPDVKKACTAASLAGIGGGERNRTAGLLIANQTLSQLSYTPTAGAHPKGKCALWEEQACSLLAPSSNVRFLPNRNVRW